MFTASIYLEPTIIILSTVKNRNSAMIRDERGLIQSATIDKCLYAALQVGGIPTSGESTFLAKLCTGHGGPVGNQIRGAPPKSPGAP
eukprot:3533117-Amphidinium_carterae.2